MNAYCDTCGAKENKSETSFEHLQPYVLKISNFIFYFILFYLILIKKLMKYRFFSRYSFIGIFSVLIDNTIIETCYFMIETLLILIKGLFVDKNNNGLLSFKIRTNKCC